MSRLSTASFRASPITSDPVIRPRESLTCGGLGDSQNTGAYPCSKMIVRIAGQPAPAPGKTISTKAKLSARGDTPKL